MDWTSVIILTGFRGPIDVRRHHAGDHDREDLDAGDLQREVIRGMAKHPQQRHGRPDKEGVRDLHLSMRLTPDTLIIC